jgi:prefoldin subunit 5
MTNEYIAARLAELERKLEELRDANRELRRQVEAIEQRTQTAFQA